MNRRRPFVFLLLASLAGPVTAEPLLRKDLVYRRTQGQALHLDLATPAKEKGPVPLVVCVHGGAWVGGHRAGHHRTIRLLAEQGFAAATVQYRLAPGARFPAQLEDVRQALAYLGTRAGEFELDMRRVGALGDSAGGHLVLLLGLAQGKLGDAEKAPRIGAVVNFFGPTDFPAWKVPPLGEVMLRLGIKKDSNRILEEFLGTSDKKAQVMQDASPIRYVDASDPPVLTFQGTLDPLVPADQARRLHAALKKVGVTERLEILEGASHGWKGERLERTDRITLEFLRRHLGKDE